MVKYNKTVIPLKDGNTLYLKSELLDEEINVDELMTIDVSNLIAEIVTFPVVLQKVGILITEFNAKVSESEVNLRIWQAKKREKIRSEMEEAGEKITESKIEDKMRSDSMYLKLKKLQIKNQKYQEYLNNLFWSMKSKDDKLNKLSLTIQSGDVSEMLVKSAIKKINGVKIKLFKH